MVPHVIYAASTAQKVPRYSCTMLHPHAHTCLLMYQRCAVQVIALNLRSKAAAGQPLCPTEEEVDYALILNRALPEAIRVLGWADVKPDFHAR